MALRHDIAVAKEATGKEFYTTAEGLFQRSNLNFNAMQVMNNNRIWNCRWPEYL